MKQMCLKRRTPEKQGIDSNGILKFIKAIEASQLELHSYMVLRHGYVVSEAWWKPYRDDEPHILNSLSKSFTSTAIGLAIGEGLIQLDDLVISFFDGYLLDEVDQHLKKMTIKHLLTMNTGHAEDFIVRIFRNDEKDWVKCFFEEKVVHEPGSYFLYNNMATYMLSAIITKVTNLSLHAYLYPRLFEPLGITCEWDSCPKGINFGAFGLSLTTEAIAKFGQLYLQEGKWDGQQLIPADWVREATAYQVATNREDSSDWDQGYGYQFWRCRHDAYRGDGAFGQFCIVLPDKDTVIVTTAGVDNMPDVINAVWAHLLPAIHPHSLEHTDAYEHLQQKNSSLNYHLEGHVTSPGMKNIHGNTYALTPNDKHLQAMTFALEEEKLFLTLTISQQTTCIPVGLSHWEESMIDNDFGFKEKIRAMARWQSEDTLQIVFRYVEATYTDAYMVHFEDNAISVDFMIYHGFHASEQPMHIKGHTIDGGE